MANALYDTGRASFANAGIAWLTDTIKAQLIDYGAYTPNLATDAFISDIPAGAKIGAAVALTTKTNVAGVLGAANVSFTGLSAAPSLEAVALYKDTGTPATSQLICLIDTATGLPVPAGASQVNVTWDTGANKILKL